jgi:hypothetical protein
MKPAILAVDDDPGALTCIYFRDRRHVMVSIFVLNHVGTDLSIW